MKTNSAVIVSFFAWASSSAFVSVHSAQSTNGSKAPKKPKKKDGQKKNGEKKKAPESIERIKVSQTASLPGVSNMHETTKVIIAQSLDYPPYTSIGADLGISGFGPDFARGLEEVCDINVILVETQWSECWGNNKIGNGLLSGHFHGCSTYTATKGVRNRYVDFSAPILAMNKPAGILTRLKKGVPVIYGNSSLAGVKIGDVVGWAPTMDVLTTSKNLCTGESFSGFTPVVNSPLPGKENDAALIQLLDETIDALWIYADQASTYKKACDIDPNQAWNCSNWQKFGTDFAYIQTGVYDYMDHGTTLAISKKGSGLSETLNPCIEAFIKTESYNDLCVKYDIEAECFINTFSEVFDDWQEPYEKPTNGLTTSCSDGYCPCPV